jgi:hypothetical protein
LLEWIQAYGINIRTESDIAAWCAYHDQRAPSDPEGREYLNGIHAKVAPKREDLSTWFDVLDVDDYVSYGGKA